MEPLAASDYSRIIGGLVDNPYVGLVIVDVEGRVTLINDTYLGILGLKRDEVVGRHITEITPHSKLPQVLATEEVHLADYWPVNGHDLIVTRMPIYRDGKLIGAVGKSLFLDLNGVEVLVSKLGEVEKELAVYKDAVSSAYKPRYCFDHIVGNSPELVRNKALAERLAQTGSTVLITGESGTGKELFAHAIHHASPRRRAPFVRVNCAAMPENLLESELFGYEEGAFTGARKGGKPGKFELANRGTIFLDEIGDMPLAMQAKLLIVLQEREVERVGGSKPIRCDVHVIAATNRRLEDLVREGRFREDLYYRLNVVSLNIPPLRQRLDDIPPLLKALVPKLNQRLATKIEGATPDALRLLRSHDWPGNVRELENLLERAIILADLSGETVLMPQHFPSLQRLHHAQEQQQETTAGVSTLAAAVEQVEKTMIQRALAESGNNKARAARMLGLHISVLYRKLHRYGLS
ncbi:MAG: sigma 54-interacting transcriptional regulator [Syntrophomonadaceae bacterium]|nr:sigma 54-interacting transcriptional regulator [Syntrophomonadaceae bacterium]